VRSLLSQPLSLSARQRTLSLHSREYSRSARAQRIMQACALAHEASMRPLRRTLTPEVTTAQDGLFGVLGDQRALPSPACSALLSLTRTDC